MLDTAVILAAGAGTRLRGSAESPPKPLWPLGGKPLIARTFEAFAGAGVTDFHVVVGYRGEEVAAQLPDLLPRGCRFQVHWNPHWQWSNGRSLLCVSHAVRTPFFLGMSDHVFRPDLPSAVAKGAVLHGCLYLGVDRRIRKVFDLPDATKVVTRGGRIMDIGKVLDAYDAIDTGVFVCPAEMLDELEKRFAEINDCSISDGVRALALKGRAFAVDVGNSPWQDVDTPEAARQAEDLVAGWTPGPASEMSLAVG